MNEIKISLDNKRYDSKPVSSEAARINKRIGKGMEILDSSDKVCSFVKEVGQNGRTFSPATFLNGSKKIDNFEQMQMFVLDFDGGISYEAVCDRAKQYELPVLAAYDTFSSKNHDRFRVIFLNDTPIDDIKAAKIYKSALMQIFPESDKTDSDISKMYYGGKQLLYLDESLPTIDMESTLRNMTYYYKNEHGDTHYKSYIRRFARQHGIRLNKKGLLDISAVDGVTELMGTSVDGKNSQNPIIFYKSNGEFLPRSCFQIHLEGECTRSSVEMEHSRGHNWGNSGTLTDICCKCQLYREFETGAKRLHHHELFGLSTNIIYLETGRNVFKNILSRYPEYYDPSKLQRWEFYLKYNKESNYYPQQCSRFCAYSDICNHGANILSTVKPKRGTVERLENYSERYFPIGEVQEDLVRNLMCAINASDTRWHIIKAQTAAGKTEAFLNLMKDSDMRFLIVVPTNILKRDVEGRARKKGIELMVTPSLDEIKDEIPEHIWEHIEFLREIGQHTKVHPFISRMAAEEGITSLKKYLDDQEEFENHEGNTVTTHRKFLNMDRKALRKYDAVIIDEDIILSSIIPNQCEIPLSVIKKIQKKAEREGDPAHGQLVCKIKQLLRTIRTDTLFELPGFEWDEDEDGDPKEIDGISALTDIPSFCLAEHFICRRTAREENLPEDSVVFLKPYKFKNIKHIMVSATVDKDICEYCFGKQNVKFYECKQARYAGTLNQYPDRSMSRQYIDKNRDVLKKIPKWSGSDYMITFKKYGIGDMYFGNAIGCDHLKGQNIDVIGTPYQVDFLYKLFPFSLGLEVDEDAVMKPCLVTHNGYIFRFTTYGEDNDILRKFHLWMIESELEQAVGRARLLRCDCTVNLFSNFPLKQAVMRESGYDI
ncbi:MAG: DEAD/DEAH box helicase family protein [Lachnospiraceae bacterium]|nr:DEAD/DEAH box helicase family protein [Lachnospiraceae bacterium]